MKQFILASFFLAVASASWEQNYEKYQGPLHYPKIHDGVPVEPTAVQHARQTHLMALSQASNDHSHIGHHDNYQQHHEEHKWQGAQHHPVIHKGVPVEPAEVQHAREAHLKALSHASLNDQYNHQNGYEHQDHGEENKKWYGPIHIPKIYNGVPVEPVEVQHAKAAHLKALTEVQQHGGDNSHHYRKRRGAESYAHFSSVVEHEVPVYYNHNGKSHYENDNDNSQNDDQIHTPTYVNHHNIYEYAYEQIHAPVYGNHDDNDHKEVPVIGHGGIPVDTLEVQQAKAAHLAAHSMAKSKHY